MTAPALTHGRLLDLGERPTPPSWLVDGLIADTGVTAIAHPDSRSLTAIGVQTVGALLGVQTEVLGCQVATPVDGRVLVVASPDHVAQLYRGQFSDDPSVVVASMRPWNGSDTDYWPALIGLAGTEGVNAVVIDSMNTLATGNLAIAHSRAITEFSQPVVALYNGNVREAGIGGDAGWSFARRRFWVGGKPPQMKPLDSHTPGWAVTVPALADLSRGLTAQQVGQLAALARKASVVRGSPQKIAEQLLMHDWPEVVEVTGLNDPKTRDLTDGISAHFAAWESGLSGPAKAPLPDEPPF